MTFSLSAQNVFVYLIENGLCTPESQAAQIDWQPAKNFNLRLKFADGDQLLVKQERRDRSGQTAGEFSREWQIQRLFLRFPELELMRSLVSEIVHFDSEHAVLVFNYLSNYQDLLSFYLKENRYPAEIATAIGGALGFIHRATYEREEYRTTLAATGNLPHIGVDVAQSLLRLTPELFGIIPSDGLKFYALYQRYDSLGEAIAELFSSMSPCCLTHNDLKLNNILLALDWEERSNTAANAPGIIRLIDWERSGWGDPAYDLGLLISSYLQLWLSSLMISKTISIEESLRLATTPLETLQPSISALAIAYVKKFPQILGQRPDFLKRVVQFAGFGLIQTIVSTLQHQKTFGNGGICLLQVAKTLLCRPESSMSTIFGANISKLAQASIARIVY